LNMWVPPYRKSIAEREELKEMIDEMLKAGIIEPSTSPISSPVILVPKKEDKAPTKESKALKLKSPKRFCVDYRKVNANTKTRGWPMPNANDIFTRLAGSKFFSTLDLLSGYFQIEMAKESKEITDSVFYRRRTLSI
jgi:hypothetical protein